MFFSFFGRNCHGVKAHRLEPEFERSFELAWPLVGFAPASGRSRWASVWKHVVPLGKEPKGDGLAQGPARMDRVPCRLQDPSLRITLSRPYHSVQCQRVHRGT